MAVDSKCPVDAGMQKFYDLIERRSLDRKPHQEAGVRWSLINEINGHTIDDKIVRGGLIADEMGLGKTIQALGTIIGNFKHSPGTLIILPLALLDQWETTCLTILGHQPLVYHGSSRRNISREELMAAPIVITTYGLISLTKKNEENILHQLPWARLVFDEAHHLRNKKTKIFSGAIKLQSEIRWLITGTPIQNRKDDFYSLCAQMKLPQTYYTDPNNLRDLTRRFILKRTKTQAGVKLPNLQVNTVTVPWANASEKNLAEELHSLLNFSNVNVAHVDGAVASMSSGGILPILIRARQACIYPHLIAKHVQQLIDNDLLENNNNILTASQYSSKIDALISLIVQRSTSFTQRQRSKLVFCHYRGEIDIIAERLERNGLQVATFDGRTSPDERNQILTEHTDVLILQIQTGCEGLNLQHFKEVYFVSPHWNPAIEDQAIARCHRIGQQDDIDVFRLVMSPFDPENETSTLDEYASNVQTAKRDLMTILD